VFDRLADWNLDDFLAQLHAVRALGSIAELVRRVPGLAELLRSEELEEGDVEEMLASAETILDAMSADERRRPELLTGAAGAERRARVAWASGATIDDVETLVAQFLSARDHLRHIIEGTETSQDAMAALWRELSPRRREGTMALADIPEAETFSFEERVDDVLRKISRSGLASLTAEEKTLLDEASRFYKKRKDAAEEEDEDDGPAPDLGLDSLP
jgi:hypothetical protein